ncbi:MAG: adenylate kinase [Parcubacteria group bacterium]|nr:adenylate kinase [Parcubacteria group bacterium]
MRPIKTVLFTGKPGSGKGTQAARVARDLDWKHVVSGDYFRTLAKRDDRVGSLVRAVYDSGSFLPSWFITELFVRNALSVGPDEGIIFDGFGRSPRQAEEMQDVFSFLDRPYLVLNLEVHDDVARARIQERDILEKRTDSDTPEKIALRLAAYADQSRPALRVFEKNNVLYRINAERSVEDVHADVLSLLA